MFETRDIKLLKFFLETRVTKSIDFVYLVQDAYIDKLMKNYQINTNLKASSISLSQVNDEITSFKRNVDTKRVHTYRQKVRLVCYSVIITRSNIDKSAFKLVKHLFNFEPDYMTAVNHCIRYLYKTKHLEIKFDVSRNKELSKNQQNSANSKHVFETSIDALFVDEEDRRSIENYTFKLFDDLID